jgi:hypothetical protein
MHRWIAQASETPRLVHAETSDGIRQVDIAILLIKGPALGGVENDGANDEDGGGHRRSS